jgi:exopolyphosphatase/pppGpp-phosphohydrolase
MEFASAKDFIIDKIKAELPDNLFYHGLHHTLDVYEAVQLLAKTENITEEENTLLKTAAMYHDSGFTVQYKNHEEAGCNIARAVLPGFAYNPEQIECICAMIMATRVPQYPQNHLEQILCDADLDYLGRDDFYPISHSLYLELKARNLIESEEVWNRTQIKFFENHHYFTSTSNRLRVPAKMERLQEIKALVNGYGAIS